MASARGVYMFTDSAGYGGAEKALLILAEGLDRNRWKPTLVYHAGDGIAPLLEAARDRGIELWEVPPMPEGLAGARAALAFATRIRARRPAVFHAHLTWPLACKFGLAAAVSARVRAVVATVHTGLEFPVTTMARLQRRVLGAGVDRYIAVSRYVANNLYETFRWRSPKVVVVQNAIHAEPFRCTPDPRLRAALSRGESRRVVLAATRLTAQKGIPFLLEAARDVPAVQFVVAGNGPSRAELQQRAHTLGVADRVDFLGHRDDVPQLLACSDAVVLPSVYEGLPLAALEAMAAERPIVATAIGGTDEAILDGETGVLVPPGDPAALARALRELLGDPSRASRLARAGRTRVETLFSVAPMVERVTAVYDELVGLR